MESVLVITNDETWSKVVREGATRSGVKLFFRQDLTSPELRASLSRMDLVIVDIELLPAAESASINTLFGIFRESHVVAVYDPGAIISLADVRKSFIVGTSELLQKPYTDAEIARFFAHVVLTQQSDGGTEKWPPKVASQSFVSRSVF